MSTISYNRDCMQESSGTEKLKTCITHFWKEGNREHLRYGKSQLRSHCYTRKHVWVAFEATSQDKCGIFRTSSVYCFVFHGEFGHSQLRIIRQRCCTWCLNFTVCDTQIGHSAIQSQFPRSLGVLSRDVIRESLMSMISSCVSKFSFLWVWKPSRRHCPDFKAAPGHLHAFLCLTQIAT